LHLEATVGGLRKPNLHSLTRLADGNPPGVVATLRIRAGEILQIVAGAIPIRVGFRKLMPPYLFNASANWGRENSTWRRNPPRNAKGTLTRIRVPC
jgi:hypothetical protein